MFTSSLLLLLTLCKVLAVWSQNEPRPPVSGVNISYVIENQPYALHQPVVLTFDAYNGLPNAIVIDLGQNRENGFSFHLSRPDGIAMDSPSYVREGISVIGTVVLRPGESFSQKLILNERLRFDIPGKYKITGHLSQEIRDEKGDRLASDQGFHRDLEILPRSESSLRKVCQDLSDLLDKSSSYVDAALIARELAVIDDPVAVPFLAKALHEDRLVEPFIISGLVRIGNEGATQALIDTLNGRTGGAADAARQGLRRIQSNTSDPLLRELIDRALRDNKSQHNSMTPSTWRVDHL